MESLIRMLQAITNGEGNHTKYFSDGKYIQWTLFRDKIT
jgi:hypothetical protein